MCNVVGGKDRHDTGDADPVVRAERCTASLDPVVVDIHFDSLSLEIEIRVGVLLVNHIEMRLHDGRYSILHPW